MNWRPSQLTTQLEKLRKESQQKNSGGLKRDLCDTGAVFYRLSYQANWELVILCVRDKPWKMENESERFFKHMEDHRSY